MGNIIREVRRGEGGWRLIGVRVVGNLMVILETAFGEPLARSSQSRSGIPLQSLAYAMFRGVYQQIWSCPSRAECTNILDDIRPYFSFTLGCSENRS